MSSKIVASSILAIVLASATVAHAQPSSSDSAIAQSLFDEGRKLMTAKNFTEACPRLERSYKLDPAAGTLLNLAVCHEAIGKTASAYTEFRDSLAMAKRENRDDRVTFAQQHIDALKPRLSTITVKATVQNPGLEWRIDGANVGIEALGIAVPIDPGTHVIEATALGKRPWKTTVDIRKDGEAKSLEIPALVPAPPEERPEAQRPKGPSPWIWVTIGVGVVGFGAMALGGIEALTLWDTRTKNCNLGGDPNACNQVGVDADKQARTWAIVADIGLGVGAAGTLATIIVAAVGRGGGAKAKETNHVSFSPLITPSSAGFALRAAF